MSLTREQIEEYKHWLTKDPVPACSFTGRMICDLAITALSAEPVAFPLIATHFIQRAKAVIKSERMNPHDENTRLSWIETRSGAGVCDITNEEYFAIRELQKSVLPRLFTAPPDLLAENKRLREALENACHGAEIEGIWDKGWVAKWYYKARAALREPK